MSIRDYMNAAYGYICDHSAQIYTATAITASVGATILAWRNAPLYVDTVAKEQPETKVETAKVTAKYWAPVVLLQILGAYCSYKAISIEENEKAGLIAIAKASADTIGDFASAVNELPKKEQEKVKEKIVENQLERNSISGGESRQVIVTGTGEYLFYEPITTNTIRTTAEAIRSARNQVDHMLNTGDAVPLSAFLTAIGCDYSDWMTEIGWNPENGLTDIDARWDENGYKNGEPLGVIYYGNPPKYGYNKLWRDVEY